MPIKMHSSGIVLFVVLIFLQIFALLSLFYLTNVANSLKLSNQYFDRIQNEVFAEKAMNAAAVNLIKQIPFCVVDNLPHHAWHKAAPQWWRENGCFAEINKHAYYYVVEHLGEDPCAQLAMDDEVMVADYYRLTLYFPLSSTRQKIILQSTIARGKVDSLSCQLPVHHFVLGEQIRREI